MARKRFRWTRSKYKHAASLLRLMSRQLNYESCPDQPPPVVQELVDLWNRYARTPDPLLVPLSERYGDRDIPF
jgi:hypothetical protein